MAFSEGGAYRWHNGIRMRKRGQQAGRKTNNDNSIPNSPSSSSSVSSQANEDPKKKKGSFFQNLTG